MSHASNSTPQSGVYAIVCSANGKQYIGSAVNIKRRWRWHRTALRGNRHHSILLQRAWNKYGEHSFEFTVLEYCAPDVVVSREQQWLDSRTPYDPTLGYNIAAHADAPTRGRRLSAEHRAKIGVKSTGRHRTDADKAKISAAHKGRRHTPESRANMSAAHKGKTLPAEQRAKIGDASRRNWENPEYREAVSSKRRNISQETRGKLSAALTGRPCAPETRTKIAEKNSRAFVVTAPNGQEFEIKNLTEFCREHNLSAGSLSATGRGRRRHHKGWTCRRMD